MLSDTPPTECASYFFQHAIHYKICNTDSLSQEIVHRISWKHHLKMCAVVHRTFFALPFCSKVKTAFQPLLVVGGKAFAAFFPLVSSPDKPKFLMSSPKRPIARVVLLAARHETLSIEHDAAQSAGLGCGTTAPRKRLENLPSRCRIWTFWRQNIQNIDTGLNFLSCFMLLKQATHQCQPIQWWKETLFGSSFDG